MSLDHFIHHIKEYNGQADTFNPWSQYDPTYDNDKQAPCIRAENLSDYLAPRIKRCKHILVAEAVGYQGAKFSGVPLTSERMLLGNHQAINPEVIVGHSTALRTSNPQTAINQAVSEWGYAEPTATIVWNMVTSLGISPFELLFWNIFPFHPFKLDEGRLSNRTPRAAELKLGLEYLKELIDLCGPKVQVIAIGKKAAATIGGNCATVPHPANGGAGKFRAKLPQVVSL